MKRKTASRFLLPMLLLANAGLALGLAEPGVLQCTRANGDNELRSCLTCHDGSLASNFTLKNSSTPESDPSHNHPVGVSYAEACNRRPWDFVAPASLNPNVKLVNGEVQCASCHVPASNGNWSVVKVDGVLCLTCHRK